ncbi:MAG: SpoIIE family protein phosphatase [Spirochaetes bacterium]|nr:SpoIIE family protein phosphatase [Spirochaetota bacterium]
MATLTSNIFPRLLRWVRENRLRVKSISVKMSLLYLFLAIVNMSFFTIMIYENQIDLITENSKYHVRDRTEDFMSAINKLSLEMDAGGIFHLRTRQDVLRGLAGVIEKKLSGDDSLLIFNEAGNILYKSKQELLLSQYDIRNGITAVTNLDYSGRRLYSAVDEKKFVISFYIPYRMRLIGDTILLLKMEMRDFQKRLGELYRLILVILGFLAAFHVVFAIVFQRVFIRPIQALHEKSLEISRGNLDARAEIKKKDEIGELGIAFNNMADSIQQKIITLQRQKDEMEYEMDIASGVQELIYPEVKSDRHYDLAIFHRSLAKVSGDFYDIMRLGKSRIGAILLDVTGHGVPAALITMMLKEMFNRAAPLYDNPAELIRHINTEFLRLFSKSQSIMSVYFTGIYVIIEEKSTLSYCNAGHEKSLLVKSNGESIIPLTATGGPLGVNEEMNEKYASTSIDIAKGDKIFLYTDGIVECRNPDGGEYGVEGLIHSIKSNFASPADDVLAAITGDIQAFIGTGSMRDDATILVIEVK